MPIRKKSGNLSYAPRISQITKAYYQGIINYFPWSICGHKNRRETISESDCICFDDITYEMNFLFRHFCSNIIMHSLYLEDVVCDYITLSLIFVAQEIYLINKTCFKNRENRHKANSKMNNVGKSMELS